MQQQLSQWSPLQDTCMMSQPTPSQCDPPPPELLPPPPPPPWLCTVLLPGLADEEETSETREGESSFAVNSYTALEASEVEALQGNSCTCLQSSLVVVCSLCFLICFLQCQDCDTWSSSWARLIDILSDFQLVSDPGNKEGEWAGETGAESSSCRSQVSHPLVSDENISLDTWTGNILHILSMNTEHWNLFVSSLKVFTSQYSELIWLMWL